MNYYKRVFLPYLSLAYKQGSMRAVNKKKEKLLNHAQKLSHKWMKSHLKIPSSHMTKKKKQIATSVLLLCLPLTLSSCMGIYEGGFECPAGTGVGCRSISDVNTMVNQGIIPKTEPDQLTPTKLEIWYAPTFRNQRSGINIEENPNNYPPGTVKQKGGQALHATSI